MKYFSLERLLDENGVVTRYPLKLGQRLSVLEYLARLFASDRAYSEQEVNEMIRLHIVYSDHVTIRRELVDFGFLIRSVDCREYRRVQELPAAASILERF